MTETISAEQYKQMEQGLKEMQPVFKDLVERLKQERTTLETKRATLDEDAFAGEWIDLTDKYNKECTEKTKESFDSIVSVIRTFDPEDYPNLVEEVESICTALYAFFYLKEGQKGDGFVIDTDPEVMDAVFEQAEQMLQSVDEVVSLIQEQLKLVQEAATGAEAVAQAGGTPEDLAKAQDSDEELKRAAAAAVGDALHKAAAENDEAAHSTADVPEKLKIYDNPLDDPEYKDFNDKTEFFKGRGVSGEERTSKVWDEFYIRFPEKAEAYRKHNPALDAVLQQWDFPPYREFLQQYIDSGIAEVRQRHPEYTQEQLDASRPGIVTLYLYANRHLFLRDFAEQNPEGFKEYQEKFEKNRIYTGYNMDFTVLVFMDRAKGAATPGDTGAIWDEFVQKYPEKAEAYKEFPPIKEALERRNAKTNPSAPAPIAPTSPGLSDAEKIAKAEELKARATELAERIRANAPVWVSMQLPRDVWTANGKTPGKPGVNVEEMINVGIAGPAQTAPKFTFDKLEVVFGKADLISGAVDPKLKLSNKNMRGLSDPALFEVTTKVGCFAVLKNKSNSEYNVSLTRPLKNTADNVIQIANVSISIKTEEDAYLISELLESDPDAFGNYFEALLPAWMLDPNNGNELIPLEGVVGVSLPERVTPAHAPITPAVPGTQPAPAPAPAPTTPAPGTPPTPTTPPNPAPGLAPIAPTPAGGPENIQHDEHIKELIKARLEHLKQTSLVDVRAELPKAVWDLNGVSDVRQIDPAERYSEGLIHEGQKAKQEFNPYQVYPNGEWNRLKSILKVKKGPGNLVQRFLDDRKPPLETVARYIIAPIPAGEGAPKREKNKKGKNPQQSQTADATISDFVEGNDSQDKAYGLFIERPVIDKDTREVTHVNVHMLLSESDAYTFAQLFDGDLANLDAVLADVIPDWMENVYEFKEITGLVGNNLPKKVEKAVDNTEAPKAYDEHINTFFTERVDQLKKISLIDVVADLPKDVWERHGINAIQIDSQDKNIKETIHVGKAAKKSFNPLDIHTPQEMANFEKSLKVKQGPVDLVNRFLRTRLPNVARYFVVPIPSEQGAAQPEKKKKGKKTPQKAGVKISDYVEGTDSEDKAYGLYIRRPVIDKVTKQVTYIDINLLVTESDAASLTKLFDGDPANMDALLRAVIPSWMDTVYEFKEIKGLIGNNLPERREKPVDNTENDEGNAEKVLTPEQQAEKAKEEAKAKEREQIKNDAKLMPFGKIIEEINMNDRGMYIDTKDVWTVYHELNDYREKVRPKLREFVKDKEDLKTLDSLSPAYAELKAKIDKFDTGDKTEISDKLRNLEQKLKSEADKVLTNVKNKKAHLKDLIAENKLSLQMAASVDAADFLNEENKTLTDEITKLDEYIKSLGRYVEHINLFKPWHTVFDKPDPKLANIFKSGKIERKPGTVVITPKAEFADQKSVRHAGPTTMVKPGTLSSPDLGKMADVKVQGELTPPGFGTLLANFTGISFLKSKWDQFSKWSRRKK